jgi:PAS domain S-box-containing protein
MSDNPKNDPMREQIHRLTSMVADLEQALEESNRKKQFFEVLINSLPGLFYVFDEKLLPIRWNKNVERVTGYAYPEITGRNLLELFEGPDRAHIRNSIRDVFRKGEGTAEAVLISKDGARTPYFFTGTRTQIGNKSFLLGVGLDLGERRAIEDTLRESEALYNIFAERMTEGVMLFRQTEILFVNKAFARMFDEEEEKDLMDRLPVELVTDSFQVYFRELYEALEAGQCNERFFQARWVTRAGREFWVEGRGNRIAWKGKPSVLLTARDITEAKLKEISMQEEAEHLRRENVTLRSSIKDRYRFGNIIGKSPAMQRVYELVLNAAASSANVIIYGESGTGKELVARAIHDMSGRVRSHFVPVNCAAIPENLLEAEFFGHKKGAFTGALADKPGFLDLADGGTLFLDEVGELNPTMQVKLLRAIEGGGYTPVGSNITKTSDFRVIAATHRNLLERSRKGLMREDFFFRIHIIPITLPPLRQRKDDIPLLVEHFLRQYSPDKKAPALPGRVLEALEAYDWPGNVRELQNVIQRYLTVKKLDFLTARGIMSEEPDPGTEPRRDPAGARVCAPAPGDPDDGDGMDLRGATETLEKTVIKEALDKNRWNKSKTAEALGISRKTLFRKMKRLGLL